MYLNKIILGVIPGVIPVVPYNFLYIAGEKQVIDAIHFSSSGEGKYHILKNDEIVAFIFTNSKSLNAGYSMPIKLNRKDRLMFVFENRDILTLDMYLSFQTTAKNT